MATQAGFNTTSVNDLISGVAIDDLIMGANVPAHVFMGLAKIVDVPPGSDTYRFPRWDTVSVSATLAESDEAAFTSITTSAESVNGSVYPVRSFLSDEAQHDAKLTVEMALARQAEILMDGMDKNFLAAISSATNTSNHTGVALDLDKWEVAKTAIIAKNPNAGDLVFIGTPKQVGDIETAIRSNGGGSMVVGAGSELFNSMPLSVYRGLYNGVHFFASTNVPDSGGADASAAFMVAGAAIGMAFWFRMKSKGVDAAGRAGVDLMSYARYGLTIVNQNNLREVISLKS